MGIIAHGAIYRIETTYASKGCTCRQIMKALFLLLIFADSLSRSRISSKLKSVISVAISGVPDMPGIATV